MTRPDILRTHPSGRVLWLARIMWVVFVGAALGLFVIALPARLNELLTVTARGDPNTVQLATMEAQLLAERGMAVSTYALYFVILETLFALVYTAIGLLIFLRRSDDWFAMFVSLMLITFGVAIVPPIRAVDNPASGLQALVHFVEVIGWTTFYIFFYLFPDGRFVPRGARFLPLAFIAYGVAWIVFPQANVFTWSRPLAIAVFGAVMAPGVAAQIYRYRYISNELQRQQTRWVVFGLVGAAVGVGIFLIPELGMSAFSEPGFARVVFHMVGITFFAVMLLLIPITMDIAIHRAHLWQIDPILNRTFVYGSLMALIAGIFAASITLLQRIFTFLTGEKSDAAIILTTLLIVAVFTPLRARLESFAEKHFKYASKRLGLLADQIRAVLQVIDSDQITRRFLDDALATFNARGGAIYLERAGQMQLVQKRGEWLDDAQITVVLEHGATRGQVALGPRRSGAPYSAEDLANLAQIGELVARALAVAEARASHDAIANAASKTVAEADPATKEF